MVYELQHLSLIILAFLFFASRMGYLKIKDSLGIDSEIIALYLFASILLATFAPILVEYIFLDMPFNKIIFYPAQMFIFSISLLIGIFGQIICVDLISIYLNKLFKRSEGKEGIKITETIQKLFLYRLWNFGFFFAVLTIISYIYYINGG